MIGWVHCIGMKDRDGGGNKGDILSGDEMKVTDSPAETYK